jgi:hypothetical protein
VHHKVYKQFPAVVRRSPDLAPASTAGLKRALPPQQVTGDRAGQEMWLGRETGHNARSTVWLGLFSLVPLPPFFLWCTTTDEIGAMEVGDGENRGELLDPVRWDRTAGAKTLK